jgi:uncharacterized RDD family membrane protein YckC
MPPGYQGYAQQARPQFATWGARVGGHLLNGLVLAVFFAPAIVSFFVVPKTTEVCTVNGEVGLCELPTGAGWAVIIGLAVLGLVAFFVLYSRLISRTGQAWGHKVVGVRIVDARTGGNIGAGKAFGRLLFGHWVDGFLCDLGYLWPLWDAQKQTFADKIFSTYSVRA